MEGVESQPVGEKRVLGMAPMAGTCQPSATVRDVASTMPRSDAGKRAFQRRGHASMVAMTSPPRTSVCGSGVIAAPKYWRSFTAAEAAPGVCTPSRLSIWPMPMRSAIPEVNPVTTGAGTKAMKRPRPNVPMASRRIPENRP